MSVQSAMGSAKCGSTTALAIAFIRFSGVLLVVLLCGGDKHSQVQDIATAQGLAATLTSDMTEPPDA